MKKGLLLIISIFFISSGFSFAQEEKKEKPQSIKFEFDHSYSLLNSIFEHAIDIPVKGYDESYNFVTLKKHLPALKAFLFDMSSVELKNYVNFSKEEKIAFLINVYNAQMLLSITEKMPIKYMSKLGSINNPFTKQEIISLWNTKTSLLNLEKTLYSITGNYDFIFSLYLGSENSPFIRSSLSSKDVGDVININKKNYIKENSKYFKDINRLNVPRIIYWYKIFKDNKDMASYYNKIGFKLKDNPEIKALRFSWKINAFWLELN